MSFLCMTTVDRLGVPVRLGWPLTTERGAVQMASAIEALGMSLPYSSSLPAEDPMKRVECRLAGRYGGLQGLGLGSDQGLRLGFDVGIGSLSLVE